MRYKTSMHDSVTVRIGAPPEVIWDLVSDVTNTGRFSPETVAAEWVGGATGPALGARFRGRVNRNGWGVKYWTTCEIVACERPTEFAFTVVLGRSRVNTWRYHLEPTGDGTAVTESFRLEDKPWLRAYWALFGKLRRPTNTEGMRTTLERVKAAAEAR